MISSPENRCTTVHLMWKAWDSNPRRTCALASFQDWCLKPLGQPSSDVGPHCNVSATCSLMANRIHNSFLYLRPTGARDSQWFWMNMFVRPIERRSPSRHPCRHRSAGRAHSDIPTPSVPAAVGTPQGASCRPRPAYRMPPFSVQRPGG